MEVFIQLKKLPLSPTLLKVLVTTLICSISLPSQAQSALDRQSNEVVVNNGAALLGKIKSVQIAQSDSELPPLPSDDAEVAPDIELPEFDPSESDSDNGDVVPPQTEANEDEGENEPQSANEPRVLVAEVVVNGANEELEDIVYATIGTEPGRTTTRTQLQEDVNAVYATGFFQNVEVTPGDTPLGVRITFDVEPNPILSNVNVQTVTRGESEVLPAETVDEFFNSNYGEILNLRELQQGIIQINEWYSQNGYQLAQVVGAPQVSPEGNVTLVVAEGIIEDIQVRYFDEDDEPVEKGKTREFIITREVELAPGDVFNRETASRDLQRIFGLGIFEDARFSFSPGEDPSKVVVNIDVVEGSSGSVAAGAGFSSDSGLFGTASYQQKNFGGNNQTLGTEIQVGDDSLLFDVNFTDPWIAGSESRTSYTVNAFRRRSISLVFNGDDDIETQLIGDDTDGDSPRIVRTGGGINFARPLPGDPFERREWTLSTGLRYQRVEVKNDDGDITPRSEDTDPDDGIDDTFFLAGGDDGTDDLLSLSFNATRDRRNNPLQPTRGSLLRVGTEQTAPLGGIFYNRLRANYSQYLPVDIVPFGGDSETLAFNFQAGTIIGDAPPYEAFILGGSNSVRGYGDGEVGNGKSFVQATAEYRFPIFRIVGGALFFDYGSTLGSDDAVQGEPSIVRGLPGSGFGYGLGVRVQSPLGPIRVDYGINDEGDSQIQFGIGEKF